MRMNQMDDWGSKRKRFNAAGRNWMWQEKLKTSRPPSIVPTPWLSPHKSLSIMQQSAARSLYQPFNLNLFRPPPVLTTPHNSRSLQTNKLKPPKRLSLLQLNFHHAVNLCLYVKNVVGGFLHIAVGKGWVAVCEHKHYFLQFPVRSDLWHQHLAPSIESDTWYPPGAGQHVHYKVLAFLRLILCVFFLTHKV